MTTFQDVIRKLSQPCSTFNGSAKTDLDARRTNTALYQIVTAYMDAYPWHCGPRVEFVGQCFKDNALLL